VKYENPQVDEAVNLPSEHPLKDFSIVLVGVGSIAVLGFLVLILLADFATRFIPFSFEQSLVDQLGEYNPVTRLHSQQGDEDIEQYLQSLSDELAKIQGLAGDMSVTIHYIETTDVNAYATLGGHIYFFSGLLARCEDENTLAMVLSHEIAHIKHRHPIVALGRGFTIVVAMVSIFGVSQSDVANQILSYFGMATQLVFSREHEEQADNTALNTLQEYYGHVGGADRLFEILSRSDKEPLSQFLSTHPLTDKRINNLERFVATHPTSPTSSIALPSWLLQKVHGED